MEIEEIEHKIACGEMSAAQVFTQMKQHVDNETERFNLLFDFAGKVRDAGSCFSGSAKNLLQALTY